MSPLTTASASLSAARRRDHVSRLLGPLVGGLLAEGIVTDVILNPDGRLWVTRLGAEPEVAGSMTPQQAESLIAAIASTLDAVATRDKPVIEGRLLLDGSRFEGVLPPVVSTPIFAIRRHSSAVFTFDDYVAKEQMTEAQRARLERAIVDRENVLFTGGTGSGKTTLTNAALDAVVRLTPTDRIIGLEDTGELRCSAEDQTFMVATETVPLSRLIKVAMRLNGTRIIVGEVRGAEALDLLMVWNTGHPGGLATVHANIARPEAALSRLEMLVALGTQAPMQRLIAEAIDLIVCVERQVKGHRRVTQMVAVTGFDGRDYQFKPEGQ
jgi:type IV secretion system protein VirB11